MKNKPYFAIDLFAGCGGLSEGFKQAGFDVIAQIEMNKWACETLRTRNLYYELKRIGKVYLYQKYLQEEISRNEILNKFPDIQELVNSRVIQSVLGEDQIEYIIQKIRSSMNLHKVSKFHILLGGPPCQPYSLIGRARDPMRMEKDERHYLYKYYLKILEILQPDIFVYENVPGLFTAKAEGKEIFKRILKDFSLLNPPYEITPPLEQIYEDPCSYILNSADFLIPQRRKRIFLIGYKQVLNHMNPEIKNIFTYLQKQALRNKKKGCLSVDDAIGDLPPLKPGEGSDGWYNFYDYVTELKQYQIKMRRYSLGILNHKARTHMESDLERYRFFIEQHKNGNGAATLIDLKEKRPDLIPNHKHLDKFLDRFKVQWWNKPSLTITAHISKDGHYYIHPDINQCRSFTVREAARCQSFLDNFKFEGPRTAQFKQVGNAVPPLLANTIAKFILKELRKVYGK